MFNDNEVKQLVQSALDVVLATGLVLMCYTIGYIAVTLIWSLK